MKRRKNNVHSQYEISVIMFYWTMIGFLPIVLVFTYLFDLHLRYQALDIIYTVLAFNLLSLIIGSILLMIRRHKLRRKVKTHYRVEFIYLLFVSGFLVLGSVVIFDYLGGNRDYIANILVLLSAIVFGLLTFLGRKYFNLDYITRK
ncbi:MAG TPA: hypothetical protein VJ878_01325 [Candidatus Izemoplasmatales bacterium]|nr:hypothetical protein [Candidatus Izemoplasmatales bacterium]